MTLDCARVRELLDDHLDGALAPEAARAVDGHLASCGACRAEANALAALVADLAALPASIDPPAALWQAIERRTRAIALPATGAPGRTPWRVAAVAAALLIAVAAWLAGTALRRPDAGAASTTSASAAPAASPVTSPATPAHSSAGARPGGNAAGAEPAVAEAERALLRAKEHLRAALADRRDALSPDTLRLVEDNLQVIEAAILKIDAALAEEPGNPDLKRMRVAYHRKELALLERANRAASRM